MGRTSLTAAALAAASLAIAWTPPEQSKIAQEDAAISARPISGKPTTRIYHEIPPLGLDAYAGVSTRVVLADVVRSSVIDRPGRTLRTAYSLQIVETYIGPHESESVVTVPGGATEERVTVSDASPRLSPGDRVLLFLADSDVIDVTGIVGLSQGVYPVSNVGDETVVTGIHAPIGAPLDVFLARVMNGRMAFEAKLGEAR